MNANLALIPTKLTVFIVALRPEKQAAIALPMS
jgi:hypothetical protein